MSGKSPKANWLPYHPWHFYLSNVTVHNIKRHCWNGFRYRLPRHIMTTSWQSTHCTTQEILRFSETSPPLLVFTRLLQAYDTVSFLFCIRQCHDVCRLQYKDKRKTHSTPKQPLNNQTTKQLIYQTTFLISFLVNYWFLLKDCWRG